MASPWHQPRHRPDRRRSCLSLARMLATCRLGWPATSSPAACSYRIQAGGPQGGRGDQQVVAGCFPRTQQVKSLGIAGCELLLDLGKKLVEKIDAGDDATHFVNGNIQVLRAVHPHIAGYLVTFIMGTSGCSPTQVGSPWL